MRNRQSLKKIAGLLLVGIVALHLWIAANYYFIKKIELPPFYIWQTKINKP